MKKEFTIIIESASKELSDFAVKTIFATETMENFRVLESDPEHPLRSTEANLILTDGSHSPRALMALAANALSLNPRTMILNSGAHPATDETLHLIGIEPHALCGSLSRIVEFAYWNARSRDTLSDSAYALHHA